MRSILAGNRDRTRVSGRAVFASFAAMLVLAGVGASSAPASAETGQTAAAAKKKPKKPKLPAGAKKVAIKKIGSTTCGRVGSSWLPGSRLKSGYFISFAQQSKNASAAAKKAKGKKAAGLKKQAKALAGNAKGMLATCNAVPQGGGYNNPLPGGPGGLPGPSPAGPTVKGFNIKNAKAVGISSGTGAAATLSGSARGQAAASAAEPSTNLVAIEADGTVNTNVVEIEGAALWNNVKVQKVMVSPDDKLFVLFSSKVKGIPGGGDEGQSPYNNPNYWSAGCQLVRIDKSTNAARCVDPTADFQSWGFGYSGWGTFQNEQIQFGTSDAVFYKAQVCNYSGNPTNPCYTTVRKWSPAGGRETIAGSARQRVSDFVVTGNRVVVNGESGDYPTVDKWLRRYDPDRRDTDDYYLDLDGNKWGTFLTKFGDGNVYWGVQPGNSPEAVKRYLAGNDDRLDTQYWIARSGSWGQSPEAGFSWPAAGSGRDLSETLCPPNTWPLPDTCPENFTAINGSFQSTNGPDPQTRKTFALSGYTYVGSSTPPKLMSYYPTVQVYTSGIVGKPAMIALAGTNRERIVMAGRASMVSTAPYELAVLNPATGVSTRLVNSNAYEIFSISGTPDGMRVYYNAEKRSTGDLEVGYFDFADSANPTKVTLGSVNAKLDSMATFGN